MNDNKTLKTLLFTFIIISVALGGYIIYDKMFSNDNNNETLNNENKITEENQNENNQVETLEDKILQTIDEELAYLIGKKNLTELTDSEKSYIIMSLYALDQDKTIYELDNTSINELDQIKNASSLRKMDFNYEEIKYFDKNGINLKDITEPLYLLKDNVYNRAPTGHGVLLTTPYKCEQKIEQLEDKYIVNIRYAFARSTGDGPSDYELYYTIDDIKNHNVFDTIEYSEEQKVKTKEYFDNNCNNIKDKLNTHTYVFEIENNLPILADYYYN